MQYEMKRLALRGHKKVTSAGRDDQPLREGKSMRNKKNRAQRQEVRRILAAMRQELQDYRLNYEDMPDKRPVMHLNEVISRARSQVQS